MFSAKDLLNEIPIIDNCEHAYFTMVKIFALIYKPNSIYKSLPDIFINKNEIKNIFEDYQLTWSNIICEISEKKIDIYTLSAKKTFLIQGGGDEELDHNINLASEFIRTFLKIEELIGTIC